MKIKENLKNILVILIFVIIVQHILKYWFEIYKFDIKALLRNIILCAIVYYTYYTKKFHNVVYGLILFLSLLYTYNWYLEDINESYLGQDIIALPLTIPGYYFVHLDKLQTYNTVVRDYADVYKPILYPSNTGANIWYVYNNFQIGETTYYIIFSSTSKYDPYLKLWFHYGNHETRETMFFEEYFSLDKFKTTRHGDIFNSKCKGKEFDFDYTIDFKTNAFKIYMKVKQTEIKYEGTIQSSGIQCVGHVYPLSLISHIFPEAKGKITADSEERFNDQYVITKGHAYVNNVYYDNCTSWQDTQIGINTYFMTTWLWIYQRSENFCVYMLWYSDPTYYNSTDTLKVAFIYDIKNNKVILNCTTFPPDPKYVNFTGVIKCQVDTLGTSVHDNEFYYNCHIKTSNIEIISKSVPNSSIKVCNDKYMYKKIDKNVNYENMDELMNVMQEVRYDEFCNKTTMDIIYNGQEYHETSKVVVDSMTWKNGWPTGYKKRNETFFSYKSPFYINHPNRNDLNGKIAD